MCLWILKERISSVCLSCLSPTNISSHTQTHIERERMVVGGGSEIDWRRCHDYKLRGSDLKSYKRRGCVMLSFSLSLSECGNNMEESYKDKSGPSLRGVMRGEGGSRPINFMFMNFFPPSHLLSLLQLHFLYDFRSLLFPLSFSNAQYKNCGNRLLLYKEREHAVCARENSPPLPY